MIRKDYAEPFDSSKNALTAVGWILNRAVKLLTITGGLIAAMSIIIVLGADLDPLINWILL